MENQENDIDQETAIDPVEAYLSFINGSAGLIADIGQKMAQGMLAMIDGGYTIAKVIGEALGKTIDFQINILSDEEIRKLRKERRRARYQRMMTGKHNQRARSSRG